MTISRNDWLPPDLLAPLVEEVALPVALDRLEAAVSLHARAQDPLMKLRQVRFQYSPTWLRQVRFQYSPTYIEPLTASRWIENGSRGVE